MKKTLLLDADGVFVDFVKSFLQNIKKATGKVFTPEQITSPDIARSLGLSEPETQFVYSLIGPTWCERLDPIPGAVEGIERLKEHADIYIVTAPLDTVPTWIHERNAWIKKHLGLGRDNIVNTAAKQLVYGDIFVDDFIHNCVKWNKNIGGTTVLWSQPWNQRELELFEKNAIDYTMNNWSALEELVKQ